MKTHDFTDYIHYLEKQVAWYQKVASVWALIAGLFLFVGYILSLFI